MVPSQFPVVCYCLNPRGYLPTLQPPIFLQRVWPFVHRLGLAFHLEFWFGYDPMSAKDVAATLLWDVSVQHFDTESGYGVTNDQPKLVLRDAHPHSCSVSILDGVISPSRSLRCGRYPSHGSWASKDLGAAPCSISRRRLWHGDTFRVRTHAQSATRD